MDRAVVRELHRVLCMHTMNILTTRGGATVDTFEFEKSEGFGAKRPPRFAAWMTLKGKQPVSIAALASSEFCRVLLEKVFRIPETEDDPEMLAGSLSEFLNIIVGSASEYLSTLPSPPVMSLPEFGMSTGPGRERFRDDLLLAVLKTSMGTIYLGIAASESAWK